MESSLNWWLTVSALSMRSPNLPKKVLWEMGSHPSLPALAPSRVSAWSWCRVCHEKLWAWEGFRKWEDELCSGGPRGEALAWGGCGTAHGTSPNLPENASASPDHVCSKVLRNSLINYLAWTQHASCNKHIVLETIQDGQISFIDFFITMIHTFMSNFIQFLLSEIPCYL